MRVQLSHSMGSSDFVVFFVFFFLLEFVNFLFIWASVLSITVCVCVWVYCHMFDHNILNWNLMVIHHSIVNRLDCYFNIFHSHKYFRCIRNKICFIANWHIECVSIAPPLPAPVDAFSSAHFSNILLFSDKFNTPLVHFGPFCWCCFCGRCCCLPTIAIEIAPKNVEIACQPNIIRV